MQQKLKKQLFIEDVFAEIPQGKNLSLFLKTKKPDSDNDNDNENDNESDSESESDKDKCASLFLSRSEQT